MVFACGRGQREGRKGPCQGIAAVSRGHSRRMWNSAWPLSRPFSEFSFSTFACALARAQRRLAQTRKKPPANVLKENSENGLDSGQAEFHMRREWPLETAAIP